MMPKSKKWFAVLVSVTTLVLCLWSAPAAWTEGTVQVTPGEADLTSFPSIGLPVAVVNTYGVPILDLQAGSFEALEDGSPISIQTVIAQSNPNLTIAVALVLDVSNGVPIEDVKNAANQFLDCLEHSGSNNRVALIAFNSPVLFDTFDPTKEVPFTSDLDEVRAVINGLEAEGWSSVYEAIYKGVRITAQEVADRRAVIVVTDGYDINGSDPDIATRDTPISAAKERDIPIFTVGVYNPDLTFGRDPDYLKLLAFETGGQYQEATDLTQLGTLFCSVVEQLRTEYHLTLHTDLQPDGQGHVLKVRVTTPQGVGEAERIVTYPPQPPIPLILRLQRDVNGELRDLAEGAELRGRVLLVPQISAQNPLARVEYYVDGLMAYTADVEARQGQGRHEPWEWEWSTRTVTEGLHTLAIIAYDNVGNTSERFSLGVHVIPNIIEENLWLVAVATAAVILLALVLFLVLRRRPVRCPRCGNVMDRSWGGVCQFCAAVAVPIGPSTVSAPLTEPATTPYAPTVPAPGMGYAPMPTAVVGVGPAPAAGAEAGMTPPIAANTERLRREPQAMGWLVVEKGPRPGQDFRLQEVTAIGRSGENDVILDDSSVSRQHAKVRLEEQTFTLFDLGATNTTKVNGQEIAKHQLVDGDRVEIGNVVLVFKQIQSPQE